MIPNIEILTTEITEENYPNKTYNINVVAKTTINTVTPMTRSISSPNGGAIIGNAVLGLMVLGVKTSSEESDEVSFDRIDGYIDGIESIRQAIYLILSTERYQYNIYSWDYGVELVDLYGKPLPYVMSELPRRIKEALIQDNRIDDVVDFEFEQHGKKLHTTFTVVTNVGDISTELEVDV